jgi:hypothetical protein
MNTTCRKHPLNGVLLQYLHPSSEGQTSRWWGVGEGETFTRRSVSFYAFLQEAPGHQASFPQNCRDALDERDRTDSCSYQSMANIFHPLEICLILSPQANPLCSSLPSVSSPRTSRWWGVGVLELPLKLPVEHLDDGVWTYVSFADQSTR